MTTLNLRQYYPANKGGSKYYKTTGDMECDVCERVVRKIGHINLYDRAGYTSTGIIPDKTTLGVWSNYNAPYHPEGEWFLFNLTTLVCSLKCRELYVMFPVLYEDYL